MSNKLTPMQQFAIDFLAEEKREINPNYFATQWYFHKNGRYPPAASRDRFGITISAYKCLRKLAAAGLIKQRLDRRSSHTAEYFSSK